MASDKRSAKVSAKELRQQKSMLCDGLSFAASEAYKLLRTNLRFSLPEDSCGVLGITSSVRNEGKSTTAVNLSYTIAQTGKRVLLIDADMRLPSTASKLGIKGTPGLSNLLAQLNTESECIRQSAYYQNWFILPAGDIPPNPSELLESERMNALLQHYKDLFDVIIIDLPPIGIVADALAIAPWTNGLIVTVRQNYAEKTALSAAMYQIQKLGTKFLGFVMTDAPIGESSYKHYSKYGKYGKYGYDYGYDSANTGKTSRRKNEAFFNAANVSQTNDGENKESK